MKQTITPTLKSIFVLLLFLVLLVPVKAGLFRIRVDAPSGSVWAAAETDTSGTVIQAQPENLRAGTNSTQVYPNPFTSDVTIKLNSDWLNETTIKVYNAIGVLSVAQKMEGSEFELDLSQLPAGLYLMVLSDGKNTLNRRLLKK